MLSDLVFLRYRGALFSVNLLSVSVAMRHFLSLFTCQPRAEFSDSRLEQQSRANCVPILRLRPASRRMDAADAT